VITVGGMRRLRIGLLAIAACGSPRGPTPAAPTRVETTPDAAPPHSRVAEPTIETGGGENCELGTAIRLGLTPRPRVAAVAFQADAGLAVWLGGKDYDRLVVQRLTNEGVPDGSSTELALLGSAFLDGLATTNGHYVALIRTAGADPRLGQRAQARIQLFVLDNVGTKVGEIELGEGRFRDTPMLRFRDGALRVILPSSSFGADLQAQSGVVAPPSLAVALEPLADVGYHDGGYWPGDADIAVRFPRIPVTGDDRRFRFQRVRVPRELIGQPVELGLPEADLYAVENGVLVLETIEAATPRSAWNGTRYFVSTVAREADGYATQIIPITCR
jgi:hypothetical protein